MKRILILLLSLVVATPSWTCTLKQSTAATIMMGPFVDRNDGRTPETGLATVVTRISKAGGAFAAGPALGAHDENGYYPITFTTAHTDTLGELVIAVSDAAVHLPFRKNCRVDSRLLGYDEQALWWDDVNGSAGTSVGVHGVRDNPSNSAANVLTLSGSTNILKLRSPIPGRTITLSAGTWDNFGFVGDGDFIVSLNGQSCDSCLFVGTQVDGVNAAAYGVTIWESLIFDITPGPWTRIYWSGISAGPVTLGTNSTTVANSWTAENTTAVFDFGVATLNSDLSLLDYQGAVELRNMGQAGVDVAVISGEGSLTINANCTGGTINVYGLWNITDNGSATVNIYEALRGTVAGRTLDVTATGEAGIDLDNTAGTLAKTTDITGFNDLSAAQVNTEADTALSDISLNLLMSSALPTNWTTDITANSALDYLADDGTAVYDRTTDSQQAIADGGGGLTAAQVWAYDIPSNCTPSDTTACGVLDKLTEEAPTLATDVALGSLFGLVMDDGTAWTYDRTADSLEVISAASGLTAQQVRDAMKLAPTGGAPAAGSVDEHLDDILADTNELQTNQDWNVWDDAARTLTAATNITDDGGVINVTGGAVDTVTTTTTATNLTTNNDKTGYALSAAGIDSILDEPLAAHTTNDTPGDVLNMLTQDTVTLSTDVALGSIFGQLLDDGTAWSYDRTADALEVISQASGLTAQQVRDAMKLAPTGGAPAAGSVDEHLDDILTDTSTTLDDLVDDLETRLTAARAGYLDELAAANLPTDVAGVQSDTDDIQTRLPAALVSGRIDADVGGWNTTAVPAEHTAGYPIVTIKDGNGTGEINTGAGRVSFDWLTSLSALSLSAWQRTSTTATTTTIADTTLTNSLDDYYINWWVVPLSGDNYGHYRRVTDYDGTNKLFTVQPAWDFAHAAGTLFTIAWGPAPIDGLTMDSIPWNASWDAEVESEVTDALNTYDPPTNAELTARTLASADYFDFTTDAVDVGEFLGTAITETNAGDVAESWSQFWDVDPVTTNDVNDVGSGGGGGTSSDLLQNTTIATLTDQATFTLTAGSADDDAYPAGALVIVTDSVTAEQKAVGYVGDYTGATKTVTLRADPGVFTMAVGDTVDIIATGSTDADIDTILTSTNKIGAAQVVVTSPVAESGLVTLIQGDSYMAAQSRALDFSLTSNPDLSTATIAMDIHFNGVPVSGSPFSGTVVTATADAGLVRVELTSAQTALLSPAVVHQYRVTATIGGNLMTLISDSLQVTIAP